MKVQELLSNWVFAFLRVKDPEEGVEKVSALEGTPEILYFFLGLIHPDHFHRKGYYHIQRLRAPSRLNTWVYEHLVDEKEYAAYLDRYRGKNGVPADQLDAVILKKHYYPKALRILKKRKGFDLEKWTKPRTSLWYERKSNLYLKTGDEIRFDFRNSIEVFFTVKQEQDRLILAVGGSGGSSQRESNTLFTAVYYLLSKRTSVQYHGLRYNAHNQFEYLRSYPKILLTPGFGSNYPLDEKLLREIEQAGIDVHSLSEIRSSHLASR